MRGRSARRRGSSGRSSAWARGSTRGAVCARRSSGGEPSVPVPLGALRRAPRCRLRRLGELAAGSVGASCGRTPQPARSARSPRCPRHDRARAHGDVHGFGHGHGSCSRRPEHRSAHALLERRAASSAPRRGASSGAGRRARSASLRTEPAPRRRRRSGATSSVASFSSASAMARRSSRARPRPAAAPRSRTRRGSAGARCSRDVRANGRRGANGGARAQRLGPRRELIEVPFGRSLSARGSSGRA